MGSGGPIFSKMKTKIIREDYYNGSRGTFNPICSNWVKKIIRNSELRITEHIEDHSSIYSGEITNLPKNIKLGNHTWFLNFISVNGYWKSVSIYYRSGDYLLRISDHWSESNTSIKTCGFIRSCYWCLKGNTVQPVYLKNSNNKFQGGIIKMSDLEYN